MSPTPGQIRKHAGHQSGVDQKFEQQEVLENLGLDAFSSACWRFDLLCYRQGIEPSPARVP
eukprot:1941120-Karenia_brevis.AAC.1